MSKCSSEYNNPKEIVNAVITGNERLADGVYDMSLSCGDITDKILAGQFAMVYVDKGEHILPRPISICDVDVANGTVRLVYQIAGKGTEYFSGLKPGKSLRLMLPLGNGFNLAEDGHVVITGGGIGIPPMLKLCKDLLSINNRRKITVFLGYRSAAFLHEDFERLGVNVEVSTDDGSTGFKGNVIGNMDRFGLKNCSMVYGCGPLVMLRDLASYAEKHSLSCQVSMEERMACGIGACVGCVVKIKDDAGCSYKKVCKDGPVFYSGKVVFDE